MTESDNLKQPRVKPDDSLGHTLTTFAQSLAYTAVEGPSRGVAQAIDQVAHTKYDDAVQEKLGRVGIHKPEDAAFGTKAWTAEQFGTAIGMVAPMKLARFNVLGKTEKEISALQHASLLDKAMHEATISSRSGFVYGALLTPTENSKDNSDVGNFALARLSQGLKQATVFGATGFSSGLSGAVFDRAASGLESTAVSAAFKSPLQTALHSNLIRGAIGGVPGGVVQAQINAMQSGHAFATTQEIKENIAGMSMVGGAMGGAGVFKDTHSKNNFLRDTAKASKAFLDNLSALKFDALTHRKEPVFEAPLPPKPEPPVKTAPVEAAKTARPEHPFDIKFNPGDNAWAQERVDQHRTTETHQIQFATADRDSKAATADWSKFYDWGTEKRDTSVEVYRFPGLKTEIVVPSDYARILDQVREHRLNPSNNAEPVPGVLSPASPEVVARNRRVLPEEMAQMLMQLPQPDLVKSVQLLDHANPADVYKTKLKIDQVTAEGKVPNPDYKIVTLADATLDGSGVMRIFASHTNNPIDLQNTTAHEWAHMAELTPGFSSFKMATTAESQGFFARDYARENIHEDWAVHLGERILGPRGDRFAEIPEKAPARTLVMAKALRNMLEERQDNPTPQHEKFLARVNEAENVATTHLQLGILADIVGGQHEALNDKLRFLNTAAMTSHSAELHDKVLGPIEKDLMPVLAERAPGDFVANSIFANRLASNLKDNYTPEAMDAFTPIWKSLDFPKLQTHLFKMLPEEGQNALIQNLQESPSGYSRESFRGLIKGTEGEVHDKVLDAFTDAQEKFEVEGIRRHRAGEPVPEEYKEWLSLSARAAGRLIFLQGESHPADINVFRRAVHGLQPHAVQDFIREGGLAYVDANARHEALTETLANIPQGKQTELFRSLAPEYGPDMLFLSKQVGVMSPERFAQNKDFIRDKSLEILEQHMHTPEFILKHPHAIKNSQGFMLATRSMTNKQIESFLSDGALDSMTSEDRSKVLDGMSKRFALREQIDLLGAIDPATESKQRIDILAKAAEVEDPEVQAKAENQLIRIANAQLPALRARVDAAVAAGKEQPADAKVDPLQKFKNLSDYLSLRVLERKILNFDNADARLSYLKAAALDTDGYIPRDKFAVATFGLSEPEIVKFLKSGITNRMPPSEQKSFLRGLSFGRSSIISDQLLAMEIAALKKGTH